MTDLDRLDALAAAATPGPWEFDRDFVRARGVIMAGTSSNEDAAFIAACDPATIRDLVAAARERDELRAALISILTTGEYARMEAEGKAADMLGLVWPEDGEHYDVGAEA